MILAQEIKKVLTTGLLMVILSISQIPLSQAATFDVTNTTDAGWGPGPYPTGTLAEAIRLANNAGAGPHTIRILVAGTLTEGNPGPYSITNSDITIDGTLATGYSCGTGAPRFFLVGPAYNSFNITGANVTLRSIGIASFSLNVTGAGFEMYGCWIGTNTTGTAVAGAAPGPSYGVSVAGGGATIGANTTCDRNVISMQGVTNNLVVTGNGNSIVGNYFCSNATGSALIVSSTGSTMVISGNNNLIDRNVILGSSGGGNFGGIHINGASNPITITNNIIGLNASGTLANGAAGYGSAGHGIYSSATLTNSFITGNVISNNRQSGISIEASAVSLTINNNIVGLPGSGIHATNIYGNGDSGIRFATTASISNALVDNNTVCNNGLINSGGFQSTCSGIIFNGSTNIATATVSNNYCGIDRSFNLAGNQFPGIYFFSCGNMGGSNAANIMVTNNVVGDNGLGVTQSPPSNGISCALSNYITITNNYVGIGPGGQNIGNTANGIEINTSNNFIITNNNIQNNKGRRSAGQADVCAGICCFASTIGTIQGNTISNNINSGGFVPNNGVVVQQGGTILIGGTGAGQPNTIQNNGTHGVHVLNGADYVQITRNVITCNAQMGISLNMTGDPGSVSVTGTLYGNNQFGTVNDPTINLAGSGCPGTGVVGTGSQVTGTAPANSNIEVFNSPACRTCPSTRRGEGQAYLGNTTSDGSGNYTYTASVAGNLSSTATSIAQCNSGRCRTSRFSDCAVCSLPVEWLFVNATLGDGGVVVTWATASEKNSAVFVVERSFDGEHFESISQPIAAAGYSSQITHYSYTDQYTFSGIAYYRIRQVDLDGAYAYSAVKTVVSADVSLVKVFPNPFDNELNLFVAQANAGTVVVKIYDITGKVVFQKSYAAGTMLEEKLSLAFLPKGAFVISVSNGAEVNYTAKLLKD